jgi:hypothetical protein
MKKILCCLGLGFLLLSSSAALALNPRPVPDLGKPLPAKRLAVMIDKELSTNFANVQVKVDRAKRGAETVTFHGSVIGKEAKIVVPVHGVANRFTGKVEFSVEQ